MAQIPDLAQDRYRDEVGWFLYHEKYGRDKFGGPYDLERREHSRMLLDAVLEYVGRDISWIQDKTVLSIGCGCTGELVAFPAALKIAIDPLLSVYQRLGLLMEDQVGAQTLHLSIGADDLPLLDDVADLVICRNALDHMPSPVAAAQEMWRVLKQDGRLFVSVDIGGEPTPDEPTVFSVESLCALLADYFELTMLSTDVNPHSKGRSCRVRILGRKKPRTAPALDKEAILRAYEASLPPHSKRNVVVA